MSTTVRKLYASFSSTGDDVAHLDIPRAGHIVAVQMVLIASGTVANDDRIRVELSFASASQLTQNDPNGVLAEVSTQNSLTTSGGAQNSNSVVIPGIRYPVRSQDRLYLNAVVNGTITAIVAAYIHIMEGGRR